jgi:hypothetical protein
VLLLGGALVLAGGLLRAHVSGAPGAAPGDAPLALAFALAAGVHGVLAALHAPPVLAAIGLHSAAYVALVAGLGLLFAGLGMWEVLM